jgi:hypothetical protein
MPAQQSFGTDDFTRRQVDEWLVKDAQLVLFERAAQFRVRS